MPNKQKRNKRYQSIDQLYCYLSLRNHAAVLWFLFRAQDWTHDSPFSDDPRAAAAASRAAASAPAPPPSSSPPPPPPRAPSRGKGAARSHEGGGAGHKMAQGHVGQHGRYVAQFENSTITQPLFHVHRPLENDHGPGQIRRHPGELQPAVRVRVSTKVGENRLQPAGENEEEGEEVVPREYPTFYALVKNRKSRK